jgi:predicted RNA-binding Zn ribbon-like protein
MSRMGPRAPVELRLTAALSVNDLMWVANTRHGPAAHWHARPRDDERDHDHLTDPSDARRYLADHGVPVPLGPPPPDALAALHAVRDAVHGLIDGTGDAWPGDATAVLRRATFGLDAAGRLEARDDAWPGFVADLLPPLLVVTGLRDRLGRCGNPACRLAFLDDTRNGARRWCDPGGCGNRIRVRRARRGAMAAGQPPR